MFIFVVCVLFLIKLWWPKNKSIIDVLNWIAIKRIPQIPVKVCEHLCPLPCAEMYSAGQFSLTEIIYKLRLQTWQNNACCKKLWLSFDKVFFYNMRCFVLFVIAVCILLPRSPCEKDLCHLGSPLPQDKSHKTSKSPSYWGVEERSNFSSGWSRPWAKGGGGGGLDLLALSAIFPSVISSFFTQNGPLP